MGPEQPDEVFRPGLPQTIIRPIHGRGGPAGRDIRTSWWSRMAEARFSGSLTLSTLQTDSVALPEWDLPEYGELPSDLNPMTIGGLQVPEPGFL